MPRRPLRRRANAAGILEDLDPFARIDLETALGAWRIDPADLPSLAADWEKFGDALTAEWIDLAPGYRPWAWWYFEHKAERPPYSSAISPETLAVYRQRSRFHFLHDTNRAGPLLQVPEPDYLNKNSLLQPGEYDRSTTILISPVNSK